MFAQKPISIHLTQKEGLPDKQFYDIIEDKKGFIWLAASKGLYRYNGIDYKLFTHPEQIGLSVFQLNEDNDGVIWFINLSNQLFFIKDDKMELAFSFKQYFQGFPAYTIIHHNHIILYGSNKVVIFNKKTKKIILNTAGNIELGDLNICPFIINDVVYFGNTKGAFFKITKELTIKQTTLDLSININKPYGNSLIRKLGDYYIVTFQTITNNIKSRFLYKFSSPNTSNYKKLDVNIPINIEVNNVASIDNNFWLLTSNGAYKCHLKNNVLVLKQHLFSNITVTEVVKDFKGNMWFTTLEEGIYVVPNSNLEIEFSVPLYNGIEKMYLGKDNELILVDTKQKELYRLKPNTQTSETIVFNKKKDIKYLFYNEVSKDYIITSNLSSHYTIRNSELINNNIVANYSVTKDHFFINQKNLLLASNIDIAKYSINPFSKTIFKRDFTFKKRGYSCFYEPLKKESYFATIEGLFVFDEHFNKREITFNNTSVYIKDIVSLDDGSIWCMSFKKGIYKIVNGEIEMRYHIENGLFSNMNSFIRPFKNTLWIAGEKGVQQLNPVTNSFKNITKNNGIPSYDFTGMEIIDNKIYVSTSTQVFSFKPSTVFGNINNKQFKPYFTSVSVNDLKQPLKNTYTLQSNANRLDITFNTNGFSSNKNVKYKYRFIENKTTNNKWQTVTSANNLVTYNSLSQGDYTFQLKAIENEKETEIKELHFNVKGVFYKQAWFYFLASIAIIFLCWYYFKTKNKRFKEKQVLILDKQNKELENIYLQLESLRSQMNPHFIFNALNSIQDYIIKNEKKLARTFLVKFSRLIRMYLEHSQSDKVYLLEELKALNLYLELEKVRFEDLLNYEINVANNILKDSIKIPTFLIQPYVENAIKHGLLHKKENRNLKVCLTLNAEENVLICAVKDNGIGRIASAKINSKRYNHNSFSTKANEKRIHLINKTRQKPIIIKTEDLYSITKISEGTIVTVEIPIENK